MRQCPPGLQREWRRERFRASTAHNHRQSLDPALCDNYPPELAAPFWSPSCPFGHPRWMKSGETAELPGQSRARSAFQRSKRVLLAYRGSHRVKANPLTPLESAVCAALTSSLAAARLCEILKAAVARRRKPRASVRSPFCRRTPKRSVDPSEKTVSQSPCLLCLLVSPVSQSPCLPVSPPGFTRTRLS